MTCVAVSVLLAAAVIASFVHLRIDFGAMFSAQAMRLMGKFIAEFSTPDLSAPFVAKTAWATLQTLAVSALGTLLAVAAGGAMALPASGRFGIAPRLAVRTLLNFLRSVPELVWAALMVLAVGLGPFAGVLALFVHTTGTLAKLFSEAVEASDPRPVEGIRATGANALEEIVYGVIPQVMPLWISYSLYRFEANVRSASVVGMVGAGGIGVVLWEIIRGFQFAQTAAVMIILAVSVTLTDLASQRIRKLFI
jgi:phosphonate transport system permease protein